jgi:formylglycine-generating enzyme required for sulfatase activity
LALGVLAAIVVAGIVIAIEKKNARDMPPKEISNSIGMKLVLIPAGKFTMGSANDEKERDKDEGPRHEVKITKAFYMGAYEVTQNQYQTVMGNNPGWFSRDRQGKDTVTGMNTDDFPVERVSWEEAQMFLKKLSALAREKERGLTYRLPTEAEWEYAVRCVASSLEPFNIDGKPGNSISSSQANFDGKYPYGAGEKGVDLMRTCKVGSYSPNAWGLYDMHGNVAEWCQDRYGKEYYGKSPLEDPPGPAEGLNRVVRGGCWKNAGWGCRGARREGYWPGARYNYLGFRVVAVPGK